MTPTKNSNTIEGFHAVDFMRQTRQKLSDLYQSDPQQYLDRLKRAMEDFTSKRAKPAANSGFASEGDDEQTIG